MEIQITDKYKARVIPHNYQLMEFVEGGKEVRNVKTGETQIQQSGWRPKEVYYASITGIVKHVARLQADKAEDLNEWLNEFTVVIDEFEQRNKVTEI